MSRRMYNCADDTIKAAILFIQKRMNDEMKNPQRNKKQRRVSL